MYIGWPALVKTFVENSSIHLFLLYSFFNQLKMNKNHGKDRRSVQ